VLLRKETLTGILLPCRSPEKGYSAGKGTSTVVAAAAKALEQWRAGMGGAAAHKIRKHFSVDAAAMEAAAASGASFTQPLAGVGMREPATPQSFRPLPPSGEPGCIVACSR
jgi:hypothetical protein